MPTLFSFISLYDFWTSQMWLKCQLLVEEVLERRLGVKITAVERWWNVDLKNVVHEETTKDGTKLYEWHYCDGIMTRLIHWNGNGSKAVEHNYNPKNGNADGIHIQWDKIGRIVYELHYDDGECTNRTINDDLFYPHSPP